MKTAMMQKVGKTPLGHVHIKSEGIDRFALFHLHASASLIVSTSKASDSNRRNFEAAAAK